MRRRTSRSRGESWSSSGSKPGLPVPAPVRGADVSLGERIEDEAGQARREDGITCRDPVDRLQQFAAGNGLGDVAAGSGTDHGDDILGSIRHRQGEKLHPGMLRQDTAEDGLAAAAGEMDVEEDDIG